MAKCYRSLFTVLTIFSFASFKLFTAWQTDMIDILKNIYQAVILHCLKHINGILLDFQ